MARAKRSAKIARKASSKAKSRGGRPPKYRAEFVDQARRIAQQFGATDDDAALFFGVTPRTIYRWKHTHPDFAGALQPGKDVADARVEQSLYRLAIGYSHDAVKILKGKDDKPIIVEYVERRQPEVAACIFWLKNRDQKNWRDRIDAADPVKEGGVKIEGGLPDDEPLVEEPTGPAEPPPEPPEPLTDTGAIVVADADAPVPDADG